MRRVIRHRVTRRIFALPSPPHENKTALLSTTRRSGITLANRKAVYTVQRTIILAFLVLVAALAGGCSSIRTTDPPRTATEMLLMSQAATEAVGKLAADALRDRRAYIDGSFFLPQDREKGTRADHLFLMGEVRARLLREGVRVVYDRKDAEIIVEVRSGVMGIDKQNLLVGLPSVTLPGLGGAATGGVGGEPLIATPEIALIKNIKQDGVASVAIVAYWADSGELVASSGPFFGRTYRDDWWFFGYGPRTSGDIPTAQRRPGR
jgi:hypothetical protein